MVGDFQDSMAGLSESSRSARQEKLFMEGFTMIANRERLLRQNTITLVKGHGLDYADIMEILEVNWCEEYNEPSTTIWQDENHVYVEFRSIKEKNCFLTAIRNEKDKFRFGPFKVALLDLLTEQGFKASEHYKRKPIKLEIQRVGAHINLETLYNQINRFAPEGCLISPMRLGKSESALRPRSLMFSVDAAGFRYIFDEMRGAVSYNDIKTKKSTKFTPKISSRPYLCKNCHAIGRHNCLGVCCARCGGAGHLLDDCKKPTSYCGNCRRSGHRATDLDCPTYIREYLKELRKLDIPVEYFEKEKRFFLYKSLMFK